MKNENDLRLQQQNATITKKLSTGAIRDLIKVWLTEMHIDGLTHYVCDFYDERKGPPTSELLDQPVGPDTARWFKCNPSVTRRYLRDRLYADWIEPKQWKRAMKHRLNDVDLFFYEDGKGIIKFNIDCMGAADESLVKLCADETYAERCWRRMFVPANPQLSDSYRLEVVTTPDDDKVIGYSFVID